MLNNGMLLVQIVLACIGGYQLLLSCFGWFRRKTYARFAPQKSFAILIAAHNEEKVIGALLDNLKQLNYPAQLYDVFVICDNCNDRTADIARQHGVHACERHNLEKRGKGFAIEWMLKELWQYSREYDGVVMLDADNLVAQDYLLHMNNDLCNGSQVIQAYLDTKNPHDSWVTSAYAITYWYCNRLWQLPRSNLRLANFLGGTGMCFDSSLLKSIGWGATSLVEDLEFTMKCVQKGINPSFNYNAKVYDEKPLTFQASFKQRLRWMQGHFVVARKYFVPLIWSGLKERSWAKIDTAIYSLNVYNVLIGATVTMILWTDLIISPTPYLANLFEYAPYILGPIFLLNLLQFPVALILEKAPLRALKSILTFPLFLISWWPITIHAFFTQNNKVWSHTQHTTRRCPRRHSHHPRNDSGIHLRLLYMS
mgnify:CR=1 FL=1